jgi:D-glycero-alpha-D-manno-heptose-7-phosphate kinase
VTTEVRATAPVRVLDAGGWTDTWFASAGAVCHLAVEPGASVVVRQETAAAGTGERTVALGVATTGERYTFAADSPPGRHPLLEAACRGWCPAGGAVDVTVAAGVPPGSALGTSAAAVVALVGALQALAGGPVDPSQVARAAHLIETVDLGQQSGVQDQVAAAHGGCNLLTIGRYPEADVRRLALGPATWAELTRRAVTVYLGIPHRSHDVHRAVIADLAGGAADRLLAPLRAAALEAAAAAEAGDLEAYGRAMVRNTDAQAALHPSLVNPLARRVIDVARRHGAPGWKVNGAGGEGGTVTIVGADDPAPLVAALGSLPGLTVLPLRPAADGLVIERGTP